MIRLRPKTSEAEPARTSENAIVSVVTESETEAAAGESLNSRAKIGSSGCTA